MRNLNTEDIQVLFKETYPASGIFSHIDDKYKLDKYVKEHLNFINPEEIELGERRVWKRKPTPKIVKKNLTDIIYLHWRL